jgi:hypothetical protein
MLERANSAAANLLFALFCAIWPLMAFGVSPLFGVFLGAFLWPGAIYFLGRALTFQVEPDLLPSPAPAPNKPRVEVLSTGRTREDNRRALLIWVTATHSGWPRSCQHEFANFVADSLGDHRWDGTNTSPLFSNARSAYFADPRFRRGPSVELHPIRSTKQLWHPTLKKRMKLSPPPGVMKHLRAMLAHEEIGLVVIDLFPDTDELILYELFINPDLRRSGNGSATLRAVEDHAWRIGRRRVTLEARQIDPPSMSEPELVRWYQARGYTKSPRLEGGLEKRLK